MFTFKFIRKFALFSILLLATACSTVLPSPTATPTLASTPTPNLSAILSYLSPEPAADYPSSSADFILNAGGGGDRARIFELAGASLPVVEGFLTAGATRAGLRDWSFAYLNNKIGGSWVAVIKLNDGRYAIPRISEEGNPENGKVIRQLMFRSSDLGERVTSSGQPDYGDEFWEPFIVENPVGVT